MDYNHHQNLVQRTPLRNVADMSVNNKTLSVSRSRISVWPVHAICTIFGRFCTFVRDQITWPELMVAILAVVLCIGDQAIARNGIEKVPILSLPPWIALVLAPLGAGKHARWFYIPFFIVFILIEPITAFARANFGILLAGDWVGIVLCSSSSEMSWFFSQYFGIRAILAVVGVLLVLVFAIWLSMRLKRARFTRTKAFCSVLAIFVFARLTSPWKSPRATFETSSTLFLIIDSVSEWKHFHLLADMKNKPKFPNEMSVVSLVGVQGVFVMGESATRNRWGLYGYDKDTTPAMSSISNELAVFSDVVTHASTTAKAIEYILTTADINDPANLKFSMPQILRANGIDVSLISAQSKWGRYEGIEVFAFAGCDPMVFLGEQKLPEPWYDDALLPYLDDILENQRTNSVVFLHLRGSHLPCDTKYPPDEAFFKPEDLSRQNRFVVTAPNQYDNSIRFTDKLLGAIVKG